MLHLSSWFTKVAHTLGWLLALSATLLVLGVLASYGVDLAIAVVVWFSF